MLWKKFTHTVKGLTNIGIKVEHGTIYEGTMTDDGYHEFLRLLSLIGLDRCCTSEHSDGEVFRGDIKNKKETLYILITKSHTGKTGFWNVKMEYVKISYQ